LGSADKIAFVANNEIWLMNVDGSELSQLTTDGGARMICSGCRMGTDIYQRPDGQSYNIETGVVDT
jgi:Tol biopolymer transport system component